MNKGIFITFEGGEGCGKSFHIRALADYFKNLGRDCLITREPGGTPLAEKIRDILLNAKEGTGMSTRTEILLFEAARAQHVDELIRPALSEGKVVLCDRFYDSTTAYQGVARNLGAESVEWLNLFATTALKPDVTILLDISPEEGLKRAKTRDKHSTDRMGSESLSFYENVRSAFLKLATLHPKRFAVVNSSGTKEETFQKIITAINTKLNV